MTRRVARSGPLAIAIAAVVALATAPAASAAPFSGQGTGVLAFSDGVATLGPAGLQTRLAAMQPVLCAGKPPKARTLSLRTALAHAQRFVVRDAGRRAVSRFLHARDARRESRALAAAAAGAAAGRRTVALTALLRAHALAPRDATPLIGAAAFLVPAGMPNEALALLKAAARLHPAKQGPFGVSPAAALRNNEGYADLALHAWRKAEHALSAAHRSAPLLAEAERNLAAALVCDGKPQQAAQALFFGVRRQAFKGDLVVGRSNPAGLQRFASPELFDLSHGQAIELPATVYASDVTASGMLRDSYFALQHDLLTQQTQIITERGQAAGKLAQAEQTMNPATRLRTQEIVTAGQLVLADPDIQVLADKAQTLQNELHQIQLDSGDQGGYRCGDAAGTHARWLSTLQAYDTAVRNVISAAYRRQTGLAANLRNPLARDVMLADARLTAVEELELIASEAGFMASYDAGCTAAGQSGAPAEQGETKQPAPPACPTGIEGGRLSVDLKLVKIAVDCENLSVTAKIGSGWIGAFGRVSHNYRTGDTTIFGGPQAGVKKSLVTFGARASVRDGLYLTVDAAGAPKDYGFRVEHEASAKAFGVGKVSVSDGMNFTFVGTSPIASLMGL